MHTHERSFRRPNRDLNDAAATAWPTVTALACRAFAWSAAGGGTGALSAHAYGLGGEATLAASALAAAVASAVGWFLAPAQLVVPRGVNGAPVDTARGRSNAAGRQRARAGRGATGIEFASHRRHGGHVDDRPGRRDAPAEGGQA